ncbi:MAG: glycosyltransferase family protein [Crocinitomicaceae bacterium]|nr:glycosyltransferase family protein [Crocinitomicaceae bacterium]
MELNGKIVAIVQARMGSTRLPNKILKSIQGMPMLWHIVNRLKSVHEIDEVVIATSDLLKDDKVYEMATNYGIASFRGSEADVLKRFLGAAKIINAQYVIRITGDCPLVDPPTIKKLIKLYFDGDFDFCGVACGAGVVKEKNINRYPDGLDAEIFSFDILKEAHLEAVNDLHREHVTPFIWQNNTRYKLGSLYSESDYSDLRLTVDTKDDFDFIKWIYDMLYPNDPHFDLQDILELLENNPDTMTNKHLIGKEGYEEFWN